MFTCLFHNIKIKLSSLQFTVATYSAVHGYSPCETAVHPLTVLTVVTAFPPVSTDRFPLRQYELECLENYKIYNQYLGTIATSVPVKLVPIPVVSP